MTLEAPTELLAAPVPRTRRLTHVARSSLLIACLFGLDKALGLVRQVVIGRQFGVSAQLDAFNASNNLPDLLFALISGGALAVAFIPVLSQTLEEDGRQATWALFSRVANWAFLLTGALAVLITAFAGPIVRSQIGIVPGFSPELQALVVQLMRLNLIATLVFSLSGLVMAGLQANQHFLLPALAPILYTCGQIFGATILAPATGYRLGPISLPGYGMGIYGLAYGVILGAVLHLAVQIPGLIRYGFRWSAGLGLNHPGLRRVALLMGPRILSLGAFHLVFIVQDNLASRIGIGSVTALAYGWMIMQVPETIIGTALGVAILPTLSEQFARGDDRSFEAGVARAVRVLLALTAPTAAILIVVLRPLVAAAFHFDPQGTELVVWASRAYLLGLVGHSLLEVASRSFYARQNARVPLSVSALSAAAFVVLGIVLFRPLGAAGIALSNSLAFTLEALVLLFLLARRFPDVSRQAGPALRIGLATTVAAAVSYGILHWAPAPPLAAAVAAVALGGILAAPFVIPELRQLAKL